MSYRGIRLGNREPSGLSGKAAVYRFSSFSSAMRLWDSVASSKILSRTRFDAYLYRRQTSQRSQPILAIIATTLGSISSDNVRQMSPQACIEMMAVSSHVLMSSR